MRIDPSICSSVDISEMWTLEHSHEDEQFNIVPTMETFMNNVKDFYGYRVWLNLANALVIFQRHSLYRLIISQKE